MRDVRKNISSEKRTSKQPKGSWNDTLRNIRVCIKNKGLENENSQKIGETTTHK